MRLDDRRGQAPPVPPAWTGSAGGWGARPGWVVIQLICHLIGDYPLQSQPMADRKVTSWRWAFIHAAVYTLPFLLICQNWRALAIICGTHAVIDRLRLAAKWCAFYGTGTRITGLWRRWNVSAEPVPPFLAVWLTIIVDQTMHLAINYAALWAFP